MLFFDNKPASKDPWTKEVWIYDYRTNVKHTLKTNPPRLNHFIQACNPENRFLREESDRFKRFGYSDNVAQDKTSSVVLWLKDDSLSDLDNLPCPDELSTDIVENLEAALVNFRNNME